MAVSRATPTRIGRLGPSYAGRGRPSAADVLRLEARIARSEERAFAGTVRLHASRIHLAVVAERPDVVEQSAGELVYLASRRLRQLGGSDAA